MTAASPKYAPVHLTLGAVIVAGLVVAVLLLLVDDLIPSAARNVIMGLALGAAIVGTIALCNLLFRRATGSRHD